MVCIPSWQRESVRTNETKIHQHNPNQTQQANSLKGFCHVDVMSVFAYIHMVLVEGFLLVRRDNKLTPIVMALWSQLDKGAETCRDWIVEGEETRTK